MVEVAPEVRLREIAEAVGTTSRAARTTNSDLVVAAATRRPSGRSDDYQVRTYRVLLGDGAADHAVRDFLAAAAP